MIREIKMTKWEYRVIEFDTHGIMSGLVDCKKIEPKLNELSRDDKKLIKGAMS